MVKFFCPFCKEEVSREELIKAVLQAPQVSDISIQSGRIWLLLQTPHMVCKNGDTIDLHKDGLLVQKAEEELQRMHVRVEG